MARSIAFYLPQFHPTPENDEWWGPGFTEWNMVTRARPLFAGHRQPHEPGALGYYDLRLAETRAEQAALARRHGIDAFCYYHYWSGGQRLLERPIDAVLASGEPDMPFSLCWANHHWNRVWDGQAHQMLREQVYSPADDLAHARWLCEHAFSDPRYVRVDGKPFFAVFCGHAIPDQRRTTDVLRAEAQRLGIGELFLGRVEQVVADECDPVPLGYDAGIEFAPNFQLGIRTVAPELLEPHLLARRLARRPQGDVPTVMKYEDLVSAALAHDRPRWRQFRCVAPGWDNTPRRGRTSLVFVDTDPALYARWVEGALAFAGPEDLVFVNAWNEWGEGCHLEPDREWGTAFLEAHHSATS